MWKSNHGAEEHENRYMPSGFDEVLATVKILSFGEVGMEARLKWAGE